MLKNSRNLRFQKHNHTFNKFPLNLNIFSNNFELPSSRAARFAQSPTFLSTLSQNPTRLSRNSTFPQTYLLKKSRGGFQRKKIFCPEIQVLKSLSPSEVKSQMKFAQEVCEKIDGHEFWLYFKDKYYQNI